MRDAHQWAHRFHCTGALEHFRHESKGASGKRKMKKTTPSLPPIATAFNMPANYQDVLAFLAVAAEGSFAKAGVRLELSRSAVSRSVQRLEERLGTRLLMRTTRNVAMTPEGEFFYELCLPGVERISDALVQLADLREGPPRGRLRVSSTVGFGRKVIAPMLMNFCSLYPGIDLEFVLDDRVTDFTTDRFDITIRNGRLEDSGIIARRLAPMQMVVCGSPAYFEMHSPPKSIDDLQAHQCINFQLSSGRLYEWEFQEHGRRRKFVPTSGLTFNDAELVQVAVRAGLGLSQMAAYLVADSVRSGELTVCLADHLVQDRGHYLCYPTRKHVPPRIRAFVDYVLEQFARMNLTVVGD